MTVPADTRHAVLEEHQRLPRGQRLQREMEVVADLFDVAYYVSTNSGVEDLEADPLEHFCREGWLDLRKPSQDFDVWWYWMTHLDPAVESINPLVHYALVGREQGLSTRPESTDARPGHALPQGRPVRRACLVAGFDVDGIVDPSMIELLAELSRHGDVFYLFDGYLDPAEMAKLDDVTVASWAIRHGAYDFGSYSRLASDLVGWDRLQEYDEVVFVNDSCFLLRPLDDVFETMAERECDWWGLQATKGITSTRDHPGNDFAHPIGLDVLRTSLLATFEDDPTYDFLVGSYFLAVRRPVIEDPQFRKLISSVRPQRSKQLVIQKYEIGLTHLLIGRGFSFDTFIPALYPFHPVFSEWYFELLAQGFPLLKRYWLYQNHYDTPGLAQWKERILAVVPEANVEQMEQTLLRTAPDDRLRRSMAITRDADGNVVVPGEISPGEFRRRNRRTPKRPDSWVFAVDRRTHLLPDNSRAIFEAVKDDPGVTKILLTRSRRLELSGANVVSEPLLSPAGREHLLASGVVFVSGAPRLTLSAPVMNTRQTIIVVRNGLYLEKSGRALHPPGRPVPAAPSQDAEMSLAHPVPPATVTGLLVSSDLDQLAALAAERPATYEHAWRTGVPAHDFLLGDEESLPADLRAQVEGVRREVRGRRLLVFAPVRRARGTDRAPYEFSGAEVASLIQWCKRHDAVLGIREAGDDLERAYSAQFGDLALDLSQRRYPSVHAVLRAADIVLTDYSGFALDFSVTGRPVVSFAHDLDVAAGGLLFDLHHMFPGPVAESFDALEPALELAVAGYAAPHHRRVREMLVDDRDGRNTERVLERVTSVMDASNGGRP